MESCKNFLLGPLKTSTVAWLPLKQGIIDLIESIRTEQRKTSRVIQTLLKGLSLE